MEDILDKKLVHLKQKLEILQSTYVFFANVKMSPDFQTSLAQQIEHDVKPLIDKISTLVH